MTDEERAEQEHALGLWIANVNNNVLGLQHWARRLETAVKIVAPFIEELKRLNDENLNQLVALLKGDK